MAKGKQFDVFVTPEECREVLIKLYDSEVYHAFSLRFPGAHFTEEQADDLRDLFKPGYLSRYLVIRTEPFDSARLRYYWDALIDEGAVQMSLPVVRPSGGLSITTLVRGTGPAYEGAKGGASLFQALVRGLKKAAPYALKDYSKEYQFDAPVSAGVIKWIREGGKVEGW